MTVAPLKSPFVWFGGKRKVADQVWATLGDCDNYVDKEDSTMDSVRIHIAGHVRPSADWLIEQLGGALSFELSEGLNQLVEAVNAVGYALVRPLDVQKAAFNDARDQITDGSALHDRIQDMTSSLGGRS